MIPPTTDIFVKINEIPPQSPFPIQVAIGPVTIRITGIEIIIVMIGINKLDNTFGLIFFASLLISITTGIERRIGVMEEA